MLIVIALLAAAVFLHSFWKRRGWRRVEDEVFTPEQMAWIAERMGRIAAAAIPAAQLQRALGQAFAKAGVAMRPFLEKLKAENERAKRDVADEIGAARWASATELYETVNEAANQAGRMSLIRSVELVVWPSSATALADEVLAHLQEARIAADKLVDVARESRPGGQGYELRQRLMGMPVVIDERVPLGLAAVVAPGGEIVGGLVLSEGDLRGSEGVVEGG